MSVFRFGRFGYTMGNEPNYEEIKAKAKEALSKAPKATPGFNGLTWTANSSKAVSPSLPRHSSDKAELIIPEKVRG